MPPNARRSLLIVSHELHAAGAPKAMAEVARACGEGGWAVVIVAPETGPYAALADQGCVVIIHPDALRGYSPAISLAADVDLILCNSIACHDVAAQVPSGKLIWFLHETVLTRASRPSCATRATFGCRARRSHDGCDPTDRTVT